MEWKLICELSSISWKSNYFLLQSILDHFQPLLSHFLSPNSNVLLSGVSVFNNELEFGTQFTQTNEIITLAFKNHGWNYKNICCRLIVLHKPLKFIKRVVHLHPSISVCVSVSVFMYGNGFERKQFVYPHGIHLTVSVNLLAWTILSAPGHTELCAKAKFSTPWDFYAILLELSNISRN